MNTQLHWRIGSINLEGPNEVVVFAYQEYDDDSEYRRYTLRYNRSKIDEPNIRTEVQIGPTIKDLKEAHEVARPFAEAIFKVLSL